MNRVPANRVLPAVLVAAVAALAACDRAPGEASAPATDAAGTPAVAAPTAAPLPAPIAVSSVKFGRYVEPKTFAVGGIATKFKTDDQVFAAVQLDGAAGSGTVQARLLDPNGQVLFEQAREVQAGKLMKVNFQLTKGVALPLVAGPYRVETLLDGEVVDTGEITIE